MSVKNKKNKSLEIIFSNEIQKIGKPRMQLRASRVHKSKKDYNRKDKSWKLKIKDKIFDL